MLASGLLACVLWMGIRNWGCAVIVEPSFSFAARRVPGQKFDGIERVKREEREEQMGGRCIGVQ